MKVALERPHLSHALALLAVDVGSTIKDDVELPEKWQERARLAEVELSALGSEQVEALVMGEESEQAEIQKLAPNAYAILLDAFDGDLSDLLYGPLDSAFDYVAVEDRAALLTQNKKQLQSGGKS